MSPRERECIISGSVSNLAFRGRSSFIFTLKGQVRQHADLLVGEIVIDFKALSKGVCGAVEAQDRSIDHDVADGINRNDKSLSLCAVHRHRNHLLGRQLEEAINHKPIYLDLFLTIILTYCVYCFSFRCAFAFSLCSTL